MPEQTFNSDNGKSDNTFSLRSGCGGNESSNEISTQCPTCGSKNIGYDFFANLVCNDCGYFEFGAST